MCIILVVAIRLLICQMGEVKIPPLGRQTNKQIATADSPWDCLNQIYETLMSKVGGNGNLLEGGHKKAAVKVLSGL